MEIRFPAVAVTVEEARYQARKNGRSYIVATPIRTALLDYQIPSDEALKQAFEPIRERCRLNRELSSRPGVITKPARDHQYASQSFGARASAGYPACHDLRSSDRPH
jgi:hypothetical protein